MSKLMGRGFLVAIFLVAGCSESTAPAESALETETAAASAAPASTAAQGVIPQAQLDAMTKAAATGSVLEQAEQERRKQMEAQGL